MLDKLISKYALKELLEIDSLPIALADKNQKFIWFNKSFKERVSADRLKGKSITSVFGFIPQETLKELTKSKSLIIQNPANSQTLNLTVLKSTKSIDGYFIKFISVGDSAATQNEQNELLQLNLQFQKELHDILNMLAKEKSLNTIAEEILQRSIKISNSNIGLMVFYNESKKYDFVYPSPVEKTGLSPDAEKEVLSSLSFINKWLSINHRSLSALNQRNNIGFNLARVLQCESLIISPCFFDGSLLAVIIVGKKNTSYSALEINILEQYASLLAFGTGSIRSRELNTALESRLLQSQKLETIGKLSSGMAHDFSNLLSSIFGSLNLLKKRVPENDNILRLLDNIENCSIRAKDLTKGLLSYGKPTPKRKELVKPLTLLSEIEKVITQTFPKNIVFKSSIDESLYDILGNGTEIYQVLLNLCVNAKEAIEGSGVITLTSRNITINEKNIIRFPLFEKGNYVCFSVNDTGSGISEENVQKIFDPYFSTKEKETGSGLGLYVTYGIIKAHKGYIDVESSKENGTTFNVYIPAYEPAAIESGYPSDKIILLADDEIMLRDLLAELLESNGYNVIRVSSSAEVLKVLTEEIKVDMVIIDYNMPGGMNGLDCVARIRELNLDMPIILSTGSLLFDEDFDVNKMGISNMLPKPYEFDTMLTTIKKLI
ncbi:MAG: response regulator [Ignavibacteriales bacterium]|nr:MAG: response regulator [Ignavibacteriales bacterium]